MEEKITSFRDRQQFYYRGISKVCFPIYRFRCINRSDISRDYVLTLRKTYIPVAVRLSYLYKFLRDNRLECEHLSLKNDCFVIFSDAYCITVSVEWYKNANEGLSTIGNVPGIKMLHRIGVERLVRVIRKGSVGNKLDVSEKMQSIEAINQYPNPADRFARLIKSDIQYHSAD